MSIWNSNVAAQTGTEVRSSAAMRRPSATTTAVWMAVVALSYYLAARLGLLIPYVGTHVSLVWLPTGIAIASLSRLGPAMLPAIFVGGMWANATIEVPVVFRLPTGRSYAAFGC